MISETTSNSKYTFFPNYPIKRNNKNHSPKLAYVIPPIKQKEPITYQAFTQHAILIRALENRVRTIQSKKCMLETPFLYFMDQQQKEMATRSSISIFSWPTIRRNGFTWRTNLENEIRLHHTTKCLNIHYLSIWIFSTKIRPTFSHLRISFTHVVHYISKRWIGVWYCQICIGKKRCHDSPKIS